ncbi:MAG: N-glycosylase/DNA lyase [bacterium]
MYIKSEKIKELKCQYNRVVKQIEDRLKEFEGILNKGSEEDIFYELIFCLLTPQSKAKVCWSAVLRILNQDALIKCNNKMLKGCLSGVRFSNKKTEFVMSAYKQFTENGKVYIRELIRSFKRPEEARDWLVKKVKGLGYKEASHFLRNIGYGNNMAILDRHILKNLKLFGVIDDIPRTITRKKYLEIENKMAEFAKGIDIPLSHLDLLLWYRETGEIFK